MSKSKEEAVMQYAIAEHLGNKNIVIPNISFARISCRIENMIKAVALLGINIRFRVSSMKLI